MAEAAPFPLPLALSLVHPVLRWVLLGLSAYAMVLGIKAKKTRTADAETRKELIKGQFARRHYLFGSAVLAVMVLGCLGGLAVTWANNGKLFVGPHLLVGLGMTALVAAGLLAGMVARDAGTLEEGKRQFLQAHESRLMPRFWNQGLIGSEKSERGANETMVPQRGIEPPTY